MADQSIEIQIIHFNDVYNVEEQPKEPVGGAARFATALKTLRTQSSASLTVFSGDAFSPSMLSTITKGQHLVEILNLLDVDCAVLGNHDFDFGVDNLLDCMDACNFPWLNTNCYERATNEMLAQAKRFHVVERAGLHVGFIGLVEPEWVDTLSMVNEDDIEVRDFCDEGRQLALELKTGWEGQRKCDLVFALTHMRWPNDRRLAETVPEIDLILGGHDHNSGVEQINGRYLVKSGTDFRQLGRIDLKVCPETKTLRGVSVEEIVVDSRWSPDPAVEEIVRRRMGGLEEEMKRVLGRVEVELDGRFTSIRSRETNLGNWIAHIMLTSVSADLALVNSGAFRADCKFPVGDFTLKDLNLLLPYVSAVMVLRVSGQQLLAVLENAVCHWPSLEGRFCQVAGVRFTFDARRPAGQRIRREDVQLCNEEDCGGGMGEALDLQGSYRIAVTEFMAMGKDGFDVLLKCPVLLDDENGPVLTNCVQNYFRTVGVLRGFQASRTKHRQGLLSRLHRKQMVHSPSPGKRDGEESALSNWQKIRDVVFEEEEKPYYYIAPVVDERIKIL